MDEIATKWNRDTPWRQGHVLSREVVQSLDLVDPTKLESTCVVVISHDCDLANDNLQNEPNIEVIIGCYPEKENGNYFWAKAPRTLHLPTLRQNVPTLIELNATAKQFIPKEVIAAFEPDAVHSLPGTSLSILRSWLASRYNREAFSNDFVDRLSDSKTKSGLAKLIEPVGQLLSKVYFDVDAGEEIDRSDGSAYVLKIVLVYPPGDDPEKIADEIEELEEAIEALFSKRHFDKATDTWKGIVLKQCMSISEDDLPVSKVRQLVEWRLEYMTHKEDILVAASDGEP